MKHSDTASVRRFHAAELRTITFSPEPLALLALWLFLARHALPCAQVVVLYREEPRR